MLGFCPWRFALRIMVLGLLTLPHEIRDGVLEHVILVMHSAFTGLRRFISRLINVVLVCTQFRAEAEGARKSLLRQGYKVPVSRIMWITRVSVGGRSPCIQYVASRTEVEQFNIPLCRAIKCPCFPQQTNLVRSSHATSLRVFLL